MSAHKKTEFSASARSEGFTLVELLVVITIIAILSVIGITVFSGVQKSARDARRRGDVDAIAKAMEVYKSQNSTYSIATTFPCASGTWWEFTNTVWGAEGSQTGCAASVKNGLGSLFSGSIPKDPLCSGASCSNSWKDYTISQPTNDGTAFTVYAQLETVPANPCPGAPSPYNYCLKNQQ